MSSSSHIITASLQLWQILQPFCSSLSSVFLLLYQLALCPIALKSLPLVATWVYLEGCNTKQVQAGGGHYQCIVHGHGTSMEGHDFYLHNPTWILTMDKICDSQRENCTYGKKAVVLKMCNSTWDHRSNLIKGHSLVMTGYRMARVLNETWLSSIPYARTSYWTLLAESRKLN